MQQIIQWVLAIYIINDIILLNKKVQIQQNIQWSYFMETKRLEKNKFANESGCLKLIRHFK